MFTAAEKQLWLGRVPELRNRLLGNLTVFRQFHETPIIRVGDQYMGIWLEHNQDNLFLAEYAPEPAWAAQELFMHFQREDGLLPVMLSCDPEKPVHYGQVQTVWPFARCALEVAKLTGQKEEVFARIYRAGAAYDRWFGKYRNTLGTGLAEMFCEFDTGHDHDPRVTDGGIPRGCPGRDARNLDTACNVLPILSVDLSAALYGGRIALAELAEMTGSEAEAARWREQAEELREKIVSTFYCPEDGFYYDRNRFGFRKYRTEHVTRLFLNRVLTQGEFDAIYDRYFTTQGKEFCPAWPIPSVSIDDPHFDRTCPRNSWGCNSQALTALRAILWMEHYGRKADLEKLLLRWLRAFADHPETRFPQELNPFTGAPVGDGVNYTPTLLIALEALKLLAKEE